MGLEGKRILTQAEVDDAQIGLQKWHIELQDELIAKQNEQIITDELTGLANRRGFVNELGKTLQSMHQSFDQSLEKRHSNEQPALEEFSLIFLDLDNFKRVNDALGHAAGNNALIKVAEILKRSVRRGSVEARFHGDEFAIFLPRASEEEAETVAGNILKNLENDPELKKFGVSASIGVRHISKSDLTEQMTSESLTDEADMLQMKAKQGGKGRFEVYKKDQ